MRKVYKILPIFLILLTVLALSAGGIFSVKMMMDGGIMRPCPFSETGSLCSMTPLEHLSAWQNLFTTIPEKSFSFVILFLLSVFCFAIWIILNDENIFSKTLFKKRWRADWKSFDPLRIALSRGILNPKTF
jgi:hypothetical protein